MSGINLLRASAWVLLAMGLAHLAGHVSGHRQMAAPPDEPTRKLVEAMRGYVLPDFPAPRNVLELYQGFSLTMSALCALAAVLVLFAARELKERPDSLSRLARVHLAGVFVFSLISVNYFIWPPTLFLLVSFALAASAAAKLRPAARE